LRGRQPYPGEDKYYKGGWITQVHGSRDGGSIDAIQLEFPTDIRTEATDQERRTFGVELARNIENFQSLFYS
jgi:N-formylglutamate amidohydrolase